MYRHRGDVTPSTSWFFANGKDPTASVNAEHICIGKSIHEYPHLVGFSAENL